ncbi:hypothetical protein M8J77_001962 [Diaphorina citri]|nr:hypothetical protein M8J77_001962 [Diaphorina citri]
MKSKSAKLSKNGKSSISRIKKTENNLTEENVDHKRKLLRQELIELMKNNSFKMKLLKKKTTKYPLIKQVTTTNVNYSQSNNFSVFSIFFLQNTTSSLNDIHTMSTRKCTSSKLIQTLNQNFLYSEESKVNFESSNESLLNHFDEIRVTPVDFVVENMGLQLSKEMFLYVPKNNSKKSLNVIPDSNTRKQRVTKSKSSNVRSLNITKTRRSNATKLRKLAKNTSTTKKLRRTTPFDLYNFFINDKLHQNYSIQKISTSKKRYNKMRTTKMSLQRQRKLNWKNFLLSAEEIDVTEVGPTVNIFSDIKEDYPVNSSEQMSNMVTLDMKTLPDTNEVIQFWNLTFPPWRNSSESNLQTSYEGCTMNSLEAMHFIRQNYSGLLTKKSCISHMSPFHPLLNPFVTKFDESILPNDNEAKVILSKLLNESIGKVEEKYFTTPVTDSVTVISPAKWRTEDNFDDLSLSYEWKVICGQARAMTTDRYKMTTELAISLPETSEAENILNEFEWPNLFKNFSERNREQSSTSDSHLPIATLSMKESKLILSRLGVELFGQQFRIDGNYRDEKSKPKMLHSVLKSKMHDKMLKNRKLEGYVFKMMTSTSPGSHEVYVPLEYEDSRAAFNVNFDMKLFLTKLCVYLSNWKHKNQTQGKLASKKPGNSFLLGKPSYYKKRKNALI